MKTLRYIIVLFIVLFCSKSFAQADDTNSIDSLRKCLSDKSAPDSVRLKNLQDLVYVLQEKEYPVDSVLKYGKMGINIAIKIRKPDALGVLYNNIGRIYSNNQDPLCFKYFFKSLEVFESIPDTSRILAVLWTISSAYHNHNNYTLAFQYARKGIDLSLQVQDTFRLARFYRTLGLVEFQLNLPDKTLAYFNLSRKCFNDLGNSEWLPILDKDCALVKFDVTKGTRDKYTAFLNYVASIDSVTKPFYIVDSYYTLCWQGFNFLMDYSDSLTVEQKRHLKDIVVRSMEKAVDHDIYHALFEQERVSSRIFAALASKDYSKAKALVPEAVRMLSDVDNQAILYVYDALVAYYRLTEQWDKCYYYWERRFHLEEYVNSLESAVKDAGRLAQLEYEENLRIKAKEAEERNIRFEQRTEYHKVAQMVSKILVLILIVLAIAFGGNLVESHILSANLQKLNNQVLESNKKLQLHTEEILSQTNQINSHNIILKRNRDDVRFTNNLLMSDLDYAQRIQRALVPSEEKINSIFDKNFVIWRPRDIVSGDFYWVFEDKCRKYLVTADCTGHGVPGALLSMLGISILNDIAPTFASLDAHQIVGSVKAAFDSSITADNVPDGIDMAFYLVDKQTYQLQFCGARRPLFLVRDGKLTELKPDRKGIGKSVLSNKLEFTTQTAQLLKGDMVYTFSDGYSDQFGGPDGMSKYSMSRLRTMLSSVAKWPVNEQKTIVNDVINNWMSTFKPPFDSSQLDDILVIGVRF